MGAMLAYALDRFQFRLRGLVTALFAMAVMIPSVTTQVSIFTLVKGLGIYNTIFAGIVLYTSTDITQIYVFRQFMSNIPKELDESGMVEGASLSTVFFKLIIPQLTPAFATVSIIKALAIYNDILIPYLYMPKNSLNTVAQAIRLFVTDMGGKWPIVAAGVILILLPTLVIYLFAQRYIIAGISDGAVKG
jgi:multiple sugar transport system permease protein